MELWRTAKYVLTLLEMSPLCNEYIIHNLEQIQGHIYIQAHTENSWRGHMKGRPRRRRDVLWLSPWLPSLCRHALRDFPKSARDNWVLNPQGIFFHLLFFALSLLPLLQFPPSFLLSFFPKDHICLDISLPCTRLRGGCINTCVRIKFIAAYQAKWKKWCSFPWSLAVRCVFCLLLRGTSFKNIPILIKKDWNCRVNNKNR